jgi:Tfp pilus assembly protein PilN
MTSQPDQQAAETVTVTRVDWAPVPRVNLLPQEILEARGFRKVQARLAVAVVATLLLAVGAVVVGQLQVNSARNGLDQAAAQTTILQRQAARYTQVPRLIAAVAAAKASRETAMGQDVLWYRLLSDIAIAAPSNVWLTTMSVSLSTTPGAAASTSAASGSDPLVPIGIGTVTVAGTADSFPDVSAWLDSVVRVRGLEGSTLQTATRANTSGTGGQIQFTSQIVIMNAALSHRYDRKAG